MSYIEIKLTKGRSSHLRIVYWKRELVILPCRFKFEKFRGKTEQECKWYVQLKWYWLCYEFRWLIKRHRKKRKD